MASAIVDHPNRNAFLSLLMREPSPEQLNVRDSICSTLAKRNDVLNNFRNLRETKSVEWMRRKLACEGAFSKQLKGIISKAFPRLFSCDCMHATPNQRSFLQFMTVEKMEQQYPNKQQPITIVSIGSGGCLDEAELIVRLKEAGYQNLKLVLVDPSDTTLNAVADLQKLKIDLKYFDTLDKYVTSTQEDSTNRANLLLLIDLQSMPSPERGGTNLTQYTFHRLHERGALQPQTLISYTERDEASCGLFTNQTRELQELSGKSDWSAHEKAAQLKHGIA